MVLERVGLDEWFRLAAGIVTFLGVVIATLKKVRTSRLPRARLKADLEVLERVKTVLGEDSLEYQQVRERVNEWVRKAYGAAEKVGARVAWGNLALGCLFVLVFGTSFVFQVLQGFHWTLFLTGYATLFGVVLVRSSMDAGGWEAVGRRVRFRSITQNRSRLSRDRSA